MGVLADVVAERAVLSGLYHHGEDLYLDICDMVKPETFSVDSNKVIFKCLEHAIKSGDGIKLDLPTIFSAAQELNLYSFLQKDTESKHLSSIINLNTDRKNVPAFAKKIRKLEVARLLHSQLDSTKDKLLEVKGTEPISQILGLVEDAIFDFSSLLDDNDSQPDILGNNIDEYLKYLEENPVEQIGIPTGFSEWDKSIGGGLRPSTLNLIGARAKVGKTILTDNIGYHVASNNIPVLNLDTEMTKEDHTHRTISMLSGIHIDDIETGKFGISPDKKHKVYQAAEKLKDIKYYHKSIAGMPFEDQLGLMRRWVQKEVGLKKDGTANECVIIYDYLKLMDSEEVKGDLKEYQLLGFMMTTLHNFAVRYKVPFVVLIQLNRDGITKEDAGAAAGSDRIIWLCSNFSILKKKSDEDIEQDGPLAGDRKLIPIDCRHGPGVDYKDYINIDFKGWCSRMSELGLASKMRNVENEPVVIESDDDDEIPFE